MFSLIWKVVLEDGSIQTYTFGQYFNQIFELSLLMIDIASVVAIAIIAFLLLHIMVVKQEKVLAADIEWIKGIVIRWLLLSMIPALFTGMYGFFGMMGFYEWGELGAYFW